MIKRLLLFVPLILCLMSSCKEYQDMQVKGVDSFQISKLNASGIEGDVNLKIKNPNTVGFSIYPSEFDVVYSGIHLGKAKLKRRVHIKASSEEVYTFHLKSSFEGLNLMDLTSLLNSNNHGTIELNGDLKAGKFFLRKRYPVHYKDRVNLFK